MLPRSAGLPPIAHAVIIAAAACIVIAFMRWAASIVAPILLALFITMIAMPPMLWMRRKGLPKLAAVLVILLILLDVGSLNRTFAGALARLGAIVCAEDNGIRSLPAAFSSGRYGSPPP